MESKRVVLSGSNTEPEMSECEGPRERVMADDPTDEACIAKAMNCLRKCAARLTGQAGETLKSAMGTYIGL